MKENKKISKRKNYMLKKITTIISLLLIITNTTQKKAINAINPQTFEKKQCIFITKFFTKEGKGSLHTDLKVKNGSEEKQELSLFLFAFNKENVKTAKKATKGRLLHNDCEEFEGKYDTKTEYHTELKENQGSITNSNFGINTPNPGKKPLEYFFYLCDCTNKMSELYKNNPKNKIMLNYLVQVQGEDMSHHGAETSNAIGIIIFFIVVFFVLLCYGIMVAFDNKQKNDDYDYPYLITLAIPVIVLCGLIIKLLHNIIFKYNGTGISFLEIISRCWLMAADSGLSFLLILMMKGWGTKFIMFQADFDKTLMLIMISVLVRYGWTVHSWFQHHEDVYHIFEGYAGFMEIFIALFKYLWFLAYWKEGNLSATKKYRKFSKTLLILASTLFFVRPIGLFCIRYFNEVNKFSFSLFATLGANALVVLILMVVLGKADGVYMKVAFSGRVKFQMTNDEEEDDHFHVN